MDAIGRLLEQARAEGCQLRLDGGEVRVSGRCSKELATALRTAKPQILRRLRAGGEPVKRAEPKVAPEPERTVGESKSYQQFEAEAMRAWVNRG